MSRIHIIDTMFFIFRSFFSMPKLNAGVNPTGAVLGVYNALHRLLQSENITHCAAVFESSVPTFRREMDESYKANRPHAPEELKQQIPLVQEMLCVLGIPVVSVERYEADDVMGSLACRASQSGHEAVIVTNDKDLAQVLRYDGVSILRTYKQGRNDAIEHIDSHNVADVYGVPAENIPQLLAIMGDSADNIVGLKGIGPKTAAKLLREHSLEEYMREPELAGRFAAQFAEGKELLQHNLKLTTICCDIEQLAEQDVEEYRLGELDVDKAREFFASLQMRKAMSSLNVILPEHPTIADVWAM